MHFNPIGGCTLNFIEFRKLDSEYRQQFGTLTNTLIESLHGLSRAKLRDVSYK